MGLFQKISRGAGKLFQKVGSELSNPGLFQKIGKAATTINDHIQKIGNFIVPAISRYNPLLGGIGNAIQAGSSAIKNMLEKNIPKIKEIANDNSNNLYH